MNNSPHTTCPATAEPAATSAIATGFHPSSPLLALASASPWSASLRLQNRYAALRGIPAWRSQYTNWERCPSRPTPPSDGLDMLLALAPTEVQVAHRRGTAAGSLFWTRYSSSHSTSVGSFMSEILDFYRAVKSLLSCFVDRSCLSYQSTIVLSNRFANGTI